MNRSSNKRERLERTLSGEATDRPPVALWRHFPGDDQRAADLAAATLEWQAHYDWDFAKITPANTFSVVDYGLAEGWIGNIEGIREASRPLIQKSVNWLDLRVLEPIRGMLRQTSDAVALIRSGLDANTPFIQTVYSPLAQAQLLAGRETVIRHLRVAPDRLKTGLGTLTESTIRFVDSLRRSGISGIYYVTHLGSFADLTEAEYRAFGRPYDLRILETFPREWWFNVLHIRGDLPMFDQFTDYPVQAIHWQDRDSELEIATAKLRYGGALCGGIATRSTLHDLTPSEIRSQGRNAIEQAGGRRFILSSGGYVYATTPFANLRAVRALVEPAS